MNRKTPTITTETTTVTPDLALEWYALSGGNRPIRRRHVDFLAGEMKNNWRLNGEPIIFAANGALIEGHHRLIACAESGVKFQTLVTRGIDPEAKATINTGSSRSGADALSFAGLTGGSASRLSVTANRLLDHDAGRLASPGALKHSNAAVVAKVAECPGLDESIRATHGCRGVAPVTQLAWLHYLVAQDHPEKADEFFTRLADGLNMKETNPIYLLRQRLINAKLNKRAVALNEALALIVKAWNAFYSGKPIRSLRWVDGTEDFPKIEGL